jgi:lipid II:glycine glycyltransferase (peptidoglycan interpeptide bridge formation enzyme)
VAGEIMDVFEINPLADPRWDGFVASHPRASVFHSSAWIDALRRTYGYTPVAFTTSLPGQELKNAVLFCRVESWLTGRRLVSLPFSDHCEPLLDRFEDLNLFAAALDQRTRDNRLRYVEIRPVCSPSDPGAFLHPHESFAFHLLDLSPGADALFRNFHKDSTQRRIRKAEREALHVEEGRSDALRDQFFHLLLLTRRRHGLPPQPKIWFDNLIDCLGENLTIRVASKENQPAAAILTLRFRTTVTYKYGCSDPKFNNLGATQLLFWRTIQEACSSGMEHLDLGRSDTDNPGLVTFKDRWGAERSTLTYLRHPLQHNSLRTRSWGSHFVRSFCTHAPDRLLSGVGTFFYRHVG